MIFLTIDILTFYAIFEYDIDCLDARLQRCPGNDPEFFSFVFARIDCFHSVFTEKSSIIRVVLDTGEIVVRTSVGLIQLKNGRLKRGRVEFTYGCKSVIDQRTVGPTYFKNIPKCNRTGNSKPNRWNRTVLN